MSRSRKLITQKKSPRQVKKISRKRNTVKPAVTKRRISKTAGKQQTILFFFSVSKKAYYKIRKNISQAAAIIRPKLIYLWQGILDKTVTYPELLHTKLTKIKKTVLKKIRIRALHQKLSNKRIYGLQRKLAVSLIVSGLFLIFFPKVYKQNAVVHIPGNPENSRATPAPLSPTLTSATDNNGPFRINGFQTPIVPMAQAPLRILIPSVNIDLPIVEAPVVSGFWKLSETTASHGMGSADPGEAGNIVIFAHARKGLFLPIRSLKKSALIYVLTKERWYRYIATEIKEVHPTEVEVIRKGDREMLTLFTCSGFLDSKRVIIHATAYYP